MLSIKNHQNDHQDFLVLLIQANNLCLMKNEQINQNQIVLMNSEQLQELIQKIQEVKAILQNKTSKDNFPDLLRTSEVKHLLKVGESTLAGLRLSGRLPFTMVGGSIYYLKKDLIKIISDNYTGSNEI